MSEAGRITSSQYTIQDSNICQTNQKRGKIQMDNPNVPIFVL